MGVEVKEVPFVALVVVKVYQSLNFSEHMVVVVFLPLFQLKVSSVEVEA